MAQKGSMCDPLLFNFGSYDLFFIMHNHKTTSYVGDNAPYAAVDENPLDCKVIGRSTKYLIQLSINDGQNDVSLKWLSQGPHKHFRWRALQQYLTDFQNSPS